jgi:hypothetical protein
MFSSPENSSTEFMHDSFMDRMYKIKDLHAENNFCGYVFFSFEQAGSSAFIQNDVMTSVEQL